MPRAKVLLLLPLVASVMWAQGSRGSFGKSFSWWESPLAGDLNLTDTQTRQIRDTVRQYRVRLADLRAAVSRAEREVENVFNDETIDQSRAHDAIDQLANARADLFRMTSQMDLKLRMILTAEQWQELQARQRGGPAGGRNAAGRRRGPDSGPKGIPVQAGSRVSQSNPQANGSQPAK